MEEFPPIKVYPGHTPPYEEDGCSGVIWGIRSPGPSWEQFGNQLVGVSRKGQDLYTGLVRYRRKGLSI